MKDLTLHIDFSKALTDKEIDVFSDKMIDEVERMNLCAYGSINSKELRYYLDCTETDFTQDKITQNFKRVLVRYKNIIKVVKIYPTT